ncbi:MAG: DUF3775 domain-containing protein [Alphaproteobacteria bacterium]
MQRNRNTPNPVAGAAKEETPMLGINPEKVCHIIVKAREFDVKEKVSDPDSGSNASDDRMTDILEDFADDPTYQELVEFIRGLDEEEQVNLVALAWVGRGTYDKLEWKAALEEARAAHNVRTAEYLTGMPMLGDFLEEGLAAFGESCGRFEMGRM